MRFAFQHPMLLLDMLSDRGLPTSAYDEWSRAESAWNATSDLTISDS